MNIHITLQTDYPELTFQILCHEQEVSSPHSSIRLMLDDANHPLNTAKQTSKKTARTFPEEPHANKKHAYETEFMRFEREAIESLQDDRQCAKTFPRRTFRRFRPWAGYEDATKYIKREDLVRLPRFPMAQRAFNPRVGVRAAPTPKTSCTSIPAKFTKTTNTTGTPETSSDGNPRRNPPRNRRKPERYLD